MALADAGGARRAFDKRKIVMSDIPASLYRKGRATQVNIEALQELIAERDAAMEAVDAQIDALRTGKLFQLR